MNIIYFPRYNGPLHEITFSLIAFMNNEGSCLSVRMRRITRAFAACIQEVWMLMKAHTNYLDHLLCCLYQNMRLLETNCAYAISTEISFARPNSVFMTTSERDTITRTKIAPTRPHNTAKIHA